MKQSDGYFAGESPGKDLKKMLDHTNETSEEWNNRRLAGWRRLTPSQRDYIRRTDRKSVPLGVSLEIEAPIHGVDCKKEPHDLSQGYMHSPDFDGSYDVDGVKYCGRCHYHILVDGAKVEAVVKELKEKK